MTRYGWLLVFIALFSAVAGAQCREGYQPGKVVKVLDLDLTARGQKKPLGAEQEPNPDSATSIRTIIFSAEGKRYQMRLPSADSSKAYNLGSNDEVCFRDDKGAIKVATIKGIALPGTAKRIPTLPRK